MDGDCCSHCRDSQNRITDLERLVEDQANALRHWTERVKSLEAWNRPIG